MTRVPDPGASQRVPAKVLGGLLEALPDWVVIKDCDDRWQVANAAACRALNLAAGTWAGHTDQDLAIARPELRTAFDALARHGLDAWGARAERVSREWLTLADGNRHCLEFRDIPFFTARGYRQYLLTLAVDITASEIARQHGPEPAAAGARSPGLKATDSACLEISELLLRQIGQDLHGDLGQLLASASLLADRLHHALSPETPGDIADMVQALGKLMQVAIDKTRLIAHGLSPSEREGDDLLAMLQGLAETIRQTAGMTVQVDCPAPLPPLDRDIRLHLFRILQEGASNVIRHSGATALTIALTLEDGGLTIAMTDDGIGIGADRRRSRRRGLGLRHMHDRALLIGARLEVEAIKPRGTLLRLTLPVLHSDPP